MTVPVRSMPCEQWMRIVPFPVCDAMACRMLRYALIITPGSAASTWPLSMRSRYMTVSSG